MNSTRFDRILRQVLIVPLLALLLAAAALLWQMHLANATVAEIRSADDRIEQTLYLEKLLIDEETGLRGYQTTRDPTFLEPYHAAEQRLPNVLAQRRDATRTPERRAALNELTAAYNAWHSGFAMPVIATIQAGGQTNDLELNLEGKRQMDDLRARVASLNTLTRQRRNEYTTHWEHQVRTLSILLLFAAVLLGLVLGFYIRRLLQDVSSAFRQSHDVLRMRAEQTFRSEQRLRTTLQSIGDAVVTCDPQGAIENMNAVAEQLTGWTAEQARGKPLGDVFHILDEFTREPIENPVEKVKRLNRIVAVSNHTLLKQRDGTELFIDDSGAPIRDKAGALIGVVLVFRDITLARKSQEALLANEKLAVAGRLAATIAHEIHNPLDSISNLLFLMDGQSTPEEHDQFLELARQEVSRVTQISRAMLSLYRESRAPVAIDLKDMLESILLLMDRRFVSLGVIIEPNLPPDLVIHGFPAELRQVFTNLLTNAAEASAAQPGALDAEASPVIHVEARACAAHTASDGLPRGSGALVCITDHGPGIPLAIQEQLFRPFFTTKGERGTGLGLWVSRGIITKHGGSIDLHSSVAREDHGTTIEVFLATEPTLNPAGD